jgi:hypothetical protein
MAENPTHSLELDRLTSTDATLTRGTVTTLTATTGTITNLDVTNIGTTMAPQIPLVYRVNVSTALVNAGATAVVPAVTGQRFHVLSIMMRSNGAVAGATTVGIKEDGGAVFLSHIAADLTSGVWHDHATGTPVITGITSGGTTAVANKGLLAYCAGGTLITATSIDYIVCGYYTTT